MSRNLYGEAGVAADLTRGVRWVMSGVMNLLARLFSLIGAFMLLLCAVVACLVANSNFPMAATLTFGVMCFVIAVLLHAAQFWVRPGER